MVDINNVKTIIENQLNIKLETMKYCGQDLFVVKGVAFFCTIGINNDLFVVEVFQNTNTDFYFKIYFENLESVIDFIKSNIMK